MRVLKSMPMLIGIALASAAFAEAPLSFSASGHVVAPVSIGDEDQYLFVVDTGAEGSAVYARFAQDAKLELAG